MITDYHLADMRGEQLAPALKAVSPAIKVMMITADIKVNTDVGWADVDHCLIEPFPMRDLVAAVCTLLPGDTAAR